MTLRAYQIAAVEGAMRALTISGSAIMQMPTGAGKTKAATEIVAATDGRVWFVCHRREIERQVAASFEAAGIDYGIVSPRGAPEYDKPVQIVSVHTLRRRIDELPLPSLVIWDECHHVPAPSWVAIRDRLGDARHLGLTATPERLDGKGLRDWFSELVVGPSIEKLIADGWLSPVRYFAPSDPDLTAAKMQAGDYSKRDADKVMNTPVLIGDAVAEYKRNAAGKRALAFCTSVDASRVLVARFNDEGVPALHVDGNTPDDARTAAVAALSAGRIKVLSNVEVFTEGFDVPGIDAVILMRPTKSPALLLQMIGRALRVAEGKSEAIIMDHAGLHRDHGWFASEWAWNLDGRAGKARRASAGRGPRRCPECNEVRAERVLACTCGYEFPTGREVGEFDGILGEVREAASVAPWWRRLAGLFGVHPESMRKLSDRLPRGADGLIDVELSAMWVRSNWFPKNCPPLDVEDPSEYISQKAFSKKYSKARSAVAKLARDGVLETARNGWLREKSCLLYFREADNESQIGRYVTQKKFAEMTGVSAHLVAKWVAAGMPASESGKPDTTSAIEWSNKYQSAYMPPPRGVQRPEEYETKRAFYLRVKTSAKSLDRWISRGLPVGANGWVHIETGLEWIRRHGSAQRPPVDVTDADAYVRRGVFRDMIGLRGSWGLARIDTMVARGLPCASNGWVHKRRGLEWILNNTDISVPATRAA